MPSDKYFLITIDVEDWFQVENFKRWIPFETWDQRELRVEKNVHHLLDLFDSCTLPNPINSSNPINSTNPTNALTRTPRATFFMLGWLAQRLPHLVREIHSRGHEVASHGLNHELCNKMFADDIDYDVRTSKKLLEDVIGKPIYGYRAPSFSVDDSILKFVENAGYLYDSSYNSFSIHNRYGKLNLSCRLECNSPINISKTFYEIPISNFKIGDYNLPFGGGAYFRMIPFPVYRNGVERILNKGGVYSLYLHPWEFDPKQPRVNEALFQYKFRHYTNLKSTTRKLTKLIDIFSDCHFTTCHQFIEHKQKK